MAAPDLRRAVELLGAGDWPAAHAIVQEDGSALAAWLHGIVHMLEGDLDNARYWYGKAGRAFRGPEAVLEEIAAARREACDAGQRGRALLRPERPYLSGPPSRQR